MNGEFKNRVGVVREGGGGASTLWESESELEQLRRYRQTTIKAGRTRSHRKKDIIIPVAVPSPTTHRG